MATKPKAMLPIETFVKKSEDNFPDWNKQINECLSQLNENLSKSSDGVDRIFYQTNELLAKIAATFFEYGKFKDDFDHSKCSLLFRGQFLLLRSKKMNTVINWGVEGGSFFLSTSIDHWQSLRFMNDEFWSTLTELKNYGELEYEGGSGLRSTQKQYFENKTSIVFQVIRTFMLNQSLAMNEQNRSFLEFGALIIRWDIDNDCYKLLANGSKAFRLLYKLKYQLYKASGNSSEKNT